MNSSPGYMREGKSNLTVAVSFYRLLFLFMLLSGFSFGGVFGVCFVSLSCISRSGIRRLYIYYFYLQLLGFELFNVSDRKSVV